MLTFFIKPQIWLFHVVVLQTTAKKWAKVKNARAGRAKLLFLPTKYANLRRSLIIKMATEVIASAKRDLNIPSDA